MYVRRRGSREETLVTFLHFCFPVTTLTLSKRHTHCRCWDEEASHSITFFGMPPRKMTGRD